MAYQGYYSPGTVVNDASYGNKQWNYPERAKTSNNDYAACLSLRTPDSSNYLKATNFGFTIPGNATIDGIIAQIERYCTVQNGAYDLRVRAVKGGSVVGFDLDWGEDWSSTEHYVTYGGSTNKWGTTWTPAQINASNFGFVLAAYAGDGQAKVDHMRIRVYYTLPPEIAKINIGDVFKDVPNVYIRDGTAGLDWKPIVQVLQNIGDSWKTIFG